MIQPLAPHTAFTPIAVVGVSALFPDSHHVHAFWRHILAGDDLLSDIPSTHWLLEDYYTSESTSDLKTYVRRGGFVPEIDFDPLQSGLLPNALAATDPEQLLALVTAQRLLQDVRSVQENKVDLGRTNIILGTASTTALVGQMQGKLQRPVWVKALRESGLPESQVEAICERLSAAYPDWTESTFPGLLGNVVAGRIANRFDLGGTNCVVDAACASSLAAIAMGMQELHAGTADMSLTGGTDALNDIFMFMCFTKTPALSPTDDCRPFDAEADGTMLGEGFGMLALRRLDDAERDGDQIYAVIRGLGSSSDGKAKSVYAPRPSGQAQAIKRAYAQAGYPPSEVQLVEAHGTATVAGDAAELTGLQEAFGTSPEGRAQWCALGSIKSQIGHTKAAAGAASLLKVILALHHKVYPPTIKVTQPNPQLDWHESPFYLNTQSRPWIMEPGTTRKASVSSFGFGGSNFHITVEEYRGSAALPPRIHHAPGELLMFSAPNPEDLKRQMTQTATALAQAPLTQVARASQVGFEATAPLRLACVVSDHTAFGDLMAQVLPRITAQPDQRLSLPYRVEYNPLPPTPNLAFVFSGQGSQYLYMGSELAMAFDAARQIWDQAAAWRSEDDRTLHDVVFPIPVFEAAARQQQVHLLQQTEWAQPAIGAVSLAQLAVLEMVGVRAQCVAGHSYGEIPALFAAGVLASVTDVLTLSRRRGELMRDAATIRAGAMTAVRGTPTEVQAVLAESETSIHIANFNSPKQVVLTGETAAMDEVERCLQARDLPFQRLPVSTAFHSDLVSASVEPFRQALEALSVAPPQLPVYANLSGRPYPTAPGKIRDALACQLAQPVRFQDQIEAMYAQGIRTFLEVGPGTVLSGLVADHFPDRHDVVALSLDHPRQHGLLTFWHGLGTLAAAGVPVQFQRLWDGVETAEDRADPQPLSSAAVRINGANYSKPYPPRDGVSALPPPNPEWPANGVHVPEHAPVPAADPTREALTVDRVKPPRTNGSEATPAVPLLPSPELTNGSDAVRDATSVDPMIPRPGLGSEWLRAFEVVQRNTLDAQKAFQQTMTESHLAFLKASEQAFAHLGMQSTAMPDAMPAPVPAVAPPPMEMPIPLPPDAETVPFVPPQTPTPTMPVASVTESEVSGVLPEMPTALSREALHKLLLQVVADKTGYPEDVIGFDMELESELGIDSIKRVEILAALQDYIPELQTRDTAQFASLQTLRAIVDAAVQPVTVAPSEVDAPAHMQVPATISARMRATRHMIPTPATGVALPGLDIPQPLYLVRDRLGVAPQLGQRLIAAGIDTHLVDTVPGDAQAVIFLPGLEPVTNIDAALVLNQRAFRTAATCGLPHRREPGVFVTVQDTGGDFGLSGLMADQAWMAGLSALTKTAAKEWPHATVKAIDIQCQGRSPDAIADALVAELLYGGTGQDVGLPASAERVCLTATVSAHDEAPPPPTHPITKGQVFVVSGGARGITAACLQALGAQVPVKIAILGRTPLEAEPDVYPTCESDRELKHALMAQAREAGESPPPTVLAARAQTILANREIRATIQALEQRGCTVHYKAVDVGDATAVAEVIQTVRQAWGRIDGLIHAAGVLADKRIHEKTEAQFDRVFRTKVLGWHHLLDATRDEPLTHLCCFASIATYEGNIGQVDYAMANDILNKVCQAEHRRRGSECCVKSLNWGPWEGGMVSPALQAHFSAQGVALIPMATGAQWFVDELQHQTAGEVEVALGSQLMPVPVEGEMA